jgi:hypothetical protein
MYGVCGNGVQQRAQSVIMVTPTKRTTTELANSVQSVEPRDLAYSYLSLFVRLDGADPRAKTNDIPRGSPCPQKIYFPLAGPFQFPIPLFKHQEKKST